MCGLEAVVAHGPRGREPNVNGRRPSFQLVMSITVKQIGSTDGDTCCGGFDGCKGRVIIHHIVSKENLLPSAAAHIQSGKVIQRASSSNASEKSIILFVPEAMELLSVFLLRLVDSAGLLRCARQRRFRFPFFLSAGCLRRKNNQKQEAEPSDSLRVHHFNAAAPLCS